MVIMSHFARLREFSNKNPEMPVIPVIKKDDGHLSFVEFSNEYTEEYATIFREDGTVSIIFKSQVTNKLKKACPDVDWENLNWRKGIIVELSQLTAEIETSDLGEHGEQ